MNTTTSRTEIETPLIAFHGDAELKAAMLREIAWHREQDKIEHGHYGQNFRSQNTFKGCAVGCSINSLNRIKGLKLDTGNHADYEKYLGIPRILARLEDGIFEGMPSAESLDWPGKFLAAIPVGADLSMVWPQFAHWLLVDATDGVIKFAKKEATKLAIAAVGALFARWIAGDKPSSDEWWAARSAAYAYAYAYADAAAYAAAYAAAAAADAADAAARRLARLRQSEKLAELLAAAPVGTAKRISTAQKKEGGR